MKYFITGLIMVLLAFAIGEAIRLLYKVIVKKIIKKDTAAETVEEEPKNSETPDPVLMESDENI